MKLTFAIVVARLTRKQKINKILKVSFFRKYVTFVRHTYEK